MRGSATSRTTTLRAPRRGFTLVEVTISMFLTSVLLVAALVALGAVARSRHRTKDLQLGPTLARDLLAEIVQAHYREPGGTDVFGREGGESTLDRTSWDDVDDYHDLLEDVPRARDGTELSSFAGWTRGAVITKLDPVTLAELSSASPDTGVRLITVRTVSPTGHLTQLRAVRADLESLEQPPTLDSTYVSHVSVELQLDPAPSTRVRSSVNVLNHRPPLPETTSP